MNNQVIHCPLCEEGTLIPFLESKDYLVSGKIFQISTCDNCSNLVTSNAPVEAEIGDYYKSEKYISHTNTSKGIISKFYRRARMVMLGRKHKMLFNLNRQKRGSVLDIGTGTGHFLDYMKRKGWKVDGIEINDNARAYANANFGIEINSPEGIAELGSGNFDIITMWHTLEHFYNPGKYLEESLRLLKEDGYLVVALPNFKSFDAEFYNEAWAAWDVPRHLWHFSPQSVSNFVGRFGYDLKAIKRLPFDPFYISLLSEKNRKSVFPFIQGLLIGTVSWITSYFRKKRSSSLIYIFSKMA